MMLVFSFGLDEAFKTLTTYISESGIGTDISSGEDHGIKGDQSDRSIVFSRQPVINESDLFSDAISTDVSVTLVQS